MYELQGKIKGFSFDYATGGVLLQLALENKQAATACFDELKTDTRLSIKIDKYREKRSLNANNYSWSLTDKLAEVMLIQGLKLSKDEMHAEMIFRYGQPETDNNGCPIIWSTSSEIPVTEFYTYAKKIGESELNSKTYNHYRIYRGSHTYDTREMSIFISGIVEECKEQGIETLTPDQIANLKSLWGD